MILLTNTPTGYIIAIGKIPPGGIIMDNTEMRSCCMKTKMRSEQEIKLLLNRLNRIEGQVRGIKKMVESNAYCPDIIIQVSAITAALNAFNRELLSTHIRTCVADGVKNGDDGKIDELVDTLQMLLK